MVLPKGPVRAGYIYWSGKPDEQLYTLFSESMRYLSLAVNNNNKLPFSRDVLMRGKKLKSLNLYLNEEELDAAGILAHFQNLRYLQWSMSGLTTVAPMKGMLDLRELHVPMSGITDITPLVGLPKLSVVDMQETPLASLPDDGFPALRKISLFTTRVLAEAVEAFRKRHPDCVVQYEWAAELRRVAAEADRFIVRTGGTCHRQYNKE